MKIDFSKNTLIITLYNPENVSLIWNTIEEMEKTLCKKLNVDDDDFDIWICLCKDTVEAASDVFFGIVCGNDDGDKSESMYSQRVGQKLIAKTRHGRERNVHLVDSAKQIFALRLAAVGISGEPEERIEKLNARRVVV